MAERNPRPKFNEPVMRDDPVCEDAEREAKAIDWLKRNLHSRDERRKHKRPDFRSSDHYWGVITSRR